MYGCCWGVGAERELVAKNLGVRLRGFVLCCLIVESLLGVERKKNKMKESEGKAELQRMIH